MIWNPGSRALESRIQLKYPTKEWNLESKFHWKRLEYSTRNPESMEWYPKSKTVLYSLWWGDSTGLWTANYYFPFIYLPPNGAGQGGGVGSFINLHLPLSKSKLETYSLIIWVRLICRTADRRTCRTGGTYSVLSSNIEMISKCSKLKWNHEPQESGFIVKFWTLI